MKNLNSKLTILLLSFLTTTTFFAQASFDPIANQKRVDERNAIEIAEKLKIESKRKLHKDSLLAKLPKPYKIKKMNPEYSSNSSLSGKFTELEIKKELMINKNILSKMNSSLTEYLNDFNSTHKITLDSENNKDLEMKLAEKYYVGANIFTNIDDTISVDYIKFDDILESDRFIYIGNKYIKPKYYYENYIPQYSSNARLETDENPQIINYLANTTNYYNADDKYYVSIGENGNKIILQNTKTKLFYIINDSAYQKDYYDNNGKNEKLICQIPLTQAEINAKKVAFDLLVTKYRTGIKSASINRSILSSIQKKYLTRGYFDENRVNSIDKQKYNQNLTSLKSKATKMKKMQLEEDDDDKALNKLSYDEITNYVDIMNWKSVLLIN